MLRIWNLVLGFQVQGRIEGLGCKGEDLRFRV